MFECRTFITVKEIGEVLGVSESKSYGIVRDLNKELADKGYMVIPGRDRKSTRLNSSHTDSSRMPSSA